jgi:hypothetical protein
MLLMHQAMKSVNLSLLVTSLVATAHFTSGCVSGDTTEDLSEDPAADQLVDELVPSDGKADSARPQYKLTTRSIRGFYDNLGDTCSGGLDVCSSAALQLDGRRLILTFGDGEVDVRVFAKNGVLVFSTGSSLEDNRDSCDDPGCSNLLKISGVIFPVRQGSRFVPRLKAKYEAQFAHPESDEDPSGDITSTVTMTFAD